MELNQLKGADCLLLSRQNKKQHPNKQIKAWLSYKNLKHSLNSQLIVTQLRT